MIAFSKQIVRLPKAVVLKLKKRLTIREITRKVKGFHFDKWYFCQKADIKGIIPIGGVQKRGKLSFDEEKWGKNMNKIKNVFYLYKLDWKRIF